MNYQHLTIKQRYHIEAYRKAGYTQKFIANELEVSPSTISREIKRNCTTQLKVYTANSANKVSTRRRMYVSRASNKKLDTKNKNIIKKYIKQDWSPEQISNRLKMVNILNISHVSIYKLIYYDRLKGGDLYTHLRFYHTGKRRAKYGQRYKGRIEDRVSISKRSDEINDKQRIGDWEIDTIIGTNRKGAITTAVERKTSLVRISIPTTKKAIEVENEITRILSPLNKENKVKTITSDNGFEFSNHKNISKELNCDYYFCHPYSSWERGLNEYTNGLIRQYIPKKSSFENINQAYITMIEDKLNNRPRKALNWKTPNEVFYGEKIDKKIVA